MEKTYTLKIAKYLAADLKARGAKVVLTRSKDKYVGLKERVTIAKENHADCFVSLHLNSSPNKNEGSGVTTYYYHRGNSKHLDWQVSSQFHNLSLAENGIEFGDFLVIRDNPIAAILCETGYVNTKKDFKQIRKTRFQKKAAQDITKGLNQYLSKY